MPTPYSGREKDEENDARYRDELTEGKTMSEHTPGPWKMGQLMVIVCRICWFWNSPMAKTCCNCGVSFETEHN